MLLPLTTGANVMLPLVDGAEPADHAEAPEGTLQVPDILFAVANKYQPPCVLVLVLKTGHRT